MVRTRHQVNDRLCDRDVVVAGSSAITMKHHRHVALVQLGSVEGEEE